MKDPLVREKLKKLRLETESWFEEMHELHEKNMKRQADINKFLIRMHKR